MKYSADLSQKFEILFNETKKYCNMLYCTIMGIDSIARSISIII